MTPEIETTPVPSGDVATPVLFADLDLPEALLSTLSAAGYDQPSPIQAAIIPYLLAGRDVIGQAQTGTGKTAAFALPILAQLAADDEAGVKHPKGPSALVLTPTRELAIQVADAFEKYAKKMKRLGVLAVYGGADFRGQAIPLNRGVDIVVGTPGRVMDHMRRGTLDVSNVRTLVLDEADEMLRMGFVEDVEWVLSETPAGRQVALFSATMPGAIRKIAEKQLNDPERISIKGESKSADTVRQRYWRVRGVHKVDALCRLLAVEPVDSAIVFVRTRAATAELARALEDAGYPAAPLSGDIPQAQRERTIEALRQGRLKLVVATDVAARGIDVKSISHVFNFDVPEDAEAYIHRIGRTGRAGRDGEAVLFVENRQRRLLLNIEEATGQPLEKMELPTEEEVHAFQLERFGDQLKERLLRKGGSAEPAALRGFIQDICEQTGRDPYDVAAYLVGPAMNAARGSAAPDERPAQRQAPVGRNDRGAKPAPREPIGGATETYTLEVGSRDGVRAGHIVGAIANETGLDGQDINNVRIMETTCLVDLPAGMPTQVFEMLQATQVLGKPLGIRPADATPSRHRSAPKASATSGIDKPKPSSKTATSGTKAVAKKSPSKKLPMAKAKLATQTKAGGASKDKSASPPTKPRPKAKLAGKAEHQSAGSGKAFKKSKPEGKASPKPKAAATRKTKASGNAARGSSSVHSLSPAPFAGGRSKPRRLNKKSGNKR